jgi:hypothetical protein
MVDRGISYLETLEPSQVGEMGGEHTFLAYAHYKVRHDPEHPLVRRGLEETTRLISWIKDGRVQKHRMHYEVAVSVLLLASIDANKYEADLRVFQKYLFDTQRAHGGWTYRDSTDGDVSQTQYALLAIWTLDRAGLPLDYAKVSAAIQWLLRVQDPAGSWPYHGVDPGPGNPLRPQKKPTFGMGLAAGSSLLIAGDALRLWGDTADGTDPGIKGLPQSIKIYKEDTNAQRRQRATISKQPIVRSMGVLDGWLKQHPYSRATPSHQYYYYYMLYTQERYESFIETAYGRPKATSPDWYNKGVDELRNLQGPDGGWMGRAHTTPPISTGFAILFLVRSTQQSLSSMATGTASVGRGLGDFVSQTKLVDGQLITDSIAIELSRMLDLLEQIGVDDDLAGRSLPEDFELAKDPVTRSAQIDRLERLARGSQSWQARRVATHILGTSDEMRVVPSLIYALSDPDKLVRLHARGGLRVLSRKFEGFGMPDDPSNAEIRRAQQQWRDWYLSMYPDHVFWNYDD